MAENQEEQLRLCKELKKLLPTWESPITVETLAKASFLKRVVKESLRLNPISIGVGRILTQDGVIGGYDVPAGVMGT